MTTTKIRQLQRAAAQARSLSQIVDHLLETRTRGGWPVSLALTVLAVQQRAPYFYMTQRELAELVAIRAVENGCNVIFDADLLDDGPQARPAHPARIEDARI